MGMTRKLERAARRARTKVVRLSPLDSARYEKTGLLPPKREPIRRGTGVVFDELANLSREDQEILLGRPGAPVPRGTLNASCSIRP